VGRNIYKMDAIISTAVEFLSRRILEYKQSSSHQDPSIITHSMPDLHPARTNLLAL